MTRLSFSFAPKSSHARRDGIWRLMISLAHRSLLSTKQVNNMAFLWFLTDWLTRCGALRKNRSDNTVVTMPIWKHERVTCCVTEMNECDRRSSCTRRQKDFNESIMNKMIIRSFVQIDSIQIRSFIHILVQIDSSCIFKFFILHADSFFVQIRMIHSFIHSEKHPRAGLREIQTFLFYKWWRHYFCPCFTASSKYSFIVTFLLVRDSSLHYWLLASLARYVSRGSFASTAGSTLQTSKSHTSKTPDWLPNEAYDLLWTASSHPTDYKYSLLLLNLLDFIILGINRNIHDKQFTIIH